MDLLAQEIMAHQFDLKWMLRELALTQTYQRTSMLSAGADKLPEELFLAAKERPLSAEQLTRSFLRATGEEARVAEGKEKTAGGTAITRQVFAKAFTAALANAPREPELNVNPTLRAALFLRNNEFVLWSLQRRPGNLTDRLAGLADAGAVADEIYFSILSRPPVAEEKEQVAKYLAKHAADREKAVGHLAWAMLSSMEFFANH